VNPTETKTEAKDSLKGSILIGTAVVARVLVGIAIKEDPFLIFANLFVLFLMVGLVSRVSDRSTRWFAAIAPQARRQVGPGGTL
jgi:hypothetical protein